MVRNVPLNTDDFGRGPGGGCKRITPIAYSYTFIYSFFCITTLKKKKKAHIMNLLNWPLSAMGEALGSGGIKILLFS